MLLLDYYKKQDFPSLRRLDQENKKKSHALSRGNNGNERDMRCVTLNAGVLDAQVRNRAVVRPEGGSSPRGLGAGD